MTSLAQTVPVEIIAPITDPQTEIAIPDIFSKQLEEMARKMAIQFNIPVDSAVELAKSHAANIDISSIVEPRKAKKKTGPRKPRTAPDADNRCMARVWKMGCGNGKNQCNYGRKNGDYCTRHHKLALVCEEACQHDENGRKKGLFCGRIDQFAEGTSIAPYESNGILRITWCSDEHRDAVAKGLTDGTLQKTSKRKTKTKKKKKSSVVATLPTPEETEETEETFDSILQEFSLREEDDVSDAAEDDDSTDEEEEEESLDVEEWTHGGETYYVNRPTLMIYSSDGDIVGKWGEGDTVDALVPEEEEEE